MEDINTSKSRLVQHTGQYFKRGKEILYINTKSYNKTRSNACWIRQHTTSYDKTIRVPCPSIPLRRLSTRLEKTNKHTWITRRVKPSPHTFRSEETLCALLQRVASFKLAIHRSTQPDPQYYRRTRALKSSHLFQQVRRLERDKIKTQELETLRNSTSTRYPTHTRFS